MILLAVHINNLWKPTGSIARMGFAIAFIIAPIGNGTCLVFRSKINYFDRSVNAKYNARQSHYIGNETLNDKWRLHLVIDKPGYQ